MNHHLPDLSSHFISKVCGLHMSPQHQSIFFLLILPIFHLMIKAKHHTHTYCLHVTHLGTPPLFENTYSESCSDCLCMCVCVGGGGIYTSSMCRWCLYVYMFICLCLLSDNIANIYFSNFRFIIWRVWEDMSQGWICCTVLSVNYGSDVVTCSTKPLCQEPQHHEIHLPCSTIHVILLILIHIFACKDLVVCKVSSRHKK